MVINNHNSHISNVLVIGSGGAGLRAAIEAKQAGMMVTIIGKRKKEDVHTVLAAGGINAALGNLDKDDTWEQHFADTVIEGYGISEAKTVEIMAKESPALVQEIDDWGANFEKLPNGKFDQRFFGAHTYRRTCYSGDYTGRSILFALIKKANELQIPIYDYQYVSELLIENGTCFGAMAFDIRNGERTVFVADSVILAAGGHTRIWRKSSSRRNENTGDGFYLGLKAGCTLTDMEMVQFHPTGMVVPEDIAGTLVTEAVRGEGGRLFNGNGERFMEKYDPERMELSARDKVAMANYTEIIEGRGTENGGVLLDISHEEKNKIVEKLPRMYRQFLDTLMIDISKTPMEVSPTAHYSMGGIVVDPYTHSTNIEGLYAAGEITGGLHGANRLGGNSLAEILIFGKRAGKAASVRSNEITYQIRSKKAIKKAHDKLDSLTKNGSEVARPLQRQLRDIMWEHCGVVRNETRLKEGLKKIKAIKDIIPKIDVRPDSEGYEDLVLILDLEASLLSAESTIISAIQRKESRGAHQRSDHKDIDHNLSKNYRVRLNENSEIESEEQSIESISDNLQSIIDKTLDIKNYQGRLLE
ncbi:MAG: succinate dehydrogenase [Chloroflexi bacterium]|nr:succinate dehydrogenase [Chloroflexota bacterium]|tara:strand:- start:80 stop:1834 length:1755 start_codon:yes stop_codon:yes gene_type:complete